MARTIVLEVGGLGACLERFVESVVTIAVCFEFDCGVASFTLGHAVIVIVVDETFCGRSVRDMRHFEYVSHMGVVSCRRW